jgi:hypothetical protein
MNSIDGALARFLRSFERNSAAGNVSESVQQFASVFLVVDPHGAQCIRSADFAAVIPKRKQILDKFGFQSTELVGLEESWLDGRYVLAKTRWRFTFRPPTGEAQSFEVQSTFFIDTGMEPFQILLYLAHQNIMEVLKQRGFAEA